MYSSKVFTAFAVFGYAAAASSTTSSQCTVATTVTAAADATALAIACPTFAADLTIDSTIGGVLALDGIKEIDGSLIVKNAVNLTSLSAGDLTSITGTMDLEALTDLSTLEMPVLTKVNTILWATLPALQQLTFTDVVTECQSLSITDTVLQSLEGINLTTVASMTFNNNDQLTTISSAVTNITGAFAIDSNGQKLSVELPNLVSAGSMTIRNTTTLDLSMLKTVGGSFLFIENYFETLSVPNLTNVNGQLSFIANPDLTNVTMPILTKVQGFQIANNSAFLTVDGFPELKTVSGALDVTGNFTDVELPALTSVLGAFNMVSSGNITDSCNNFNSRDSANTLNVPAKITCTAKSNNVQSGTGTSGGSSSTTSGSSSTATKKSAAGQLDVPTTFGLVGGFLAMLL